MISASLAASSTTGRDSMPLNRWSSSAGIARDHLGDFGMAVAEDGAHLAGGEIEDGAAVGVIDETAGRALDDDRRELPAIADEMLARLLPEKGIGVFGHGCLG